MDLPLSGQPDDMSVEHFLNFSKWKRACPTMGDAIPGQMVLGFIRKLAVQKQEASQ